MKRRILVIVGALALVFGGVMLIGTASATSSSDAPPNPMPALSRQAATGVPTRGLISTMTFRPIAPCRIVDTRKTSALGKGSTRSFGVRGTTGFTTQGGTAGGCGVPAQAVGIATDVTAFTSTGVGYLSAWAAGGASNPYRILSYLKSSNPQTSTPMLLLAAAGAEPSLVIKSSGGKVNLAVVVTGYYVPPIQAMVFGNLLWQTSGRVLSATLLDKGVVEVEIDRNVSRCSVTATPYNMGYYASARAVGAVVEVISWYLSGTTVTYKASPVYLTVTC